MTMHTRFTKLAIATFATITLSSTHATAQPFIEIHVSGVMREFETGDDVPFGLRAIFDAGAAPDLVDSNSVHFNAVWGEAIQSMDLTPTSYETPFVPFSELPEYIPAAAVELTHIQNSNRYEMSTNLNGELLRFWVQDPIGSFSLAMTSLPDAPGDYHQTPFGSSDDWVYFDSGDGFGGWAFWNWISPGPGTILVTVRVVDGPPEPECIADLNGDGALNFLDISAYLIEYGNGCP